MPRPVVALACALVLSVAVTGLAAGPATAQSSSLRDARGDMWRWEQVGRASPAPNSEVGDIRGAVFRHDLRRIVVRVRYVDLRRSGRYANYTLRLRTREHLYREVTLEASHGDWAGRTRVFRRHDQPVDDCRVRHHLDYGRETVRISVSRECLRLPRSVEASFTSYRSDDGAFLGDNPHSDRAGGRWTGWLPAGD